MHHLPWSKSNAYSSLKKALKAWKIHENEKLANRQNSPKKTDKIILDKIDPSIYRVKHLQVNKERN